MFTLSNRNVFIGLVLCPILLTGCATQGGTDQIKGAGTGAFLGAAAGCGLGFLLGGNAAGCVKGAITGGVVGAVTGWGAVKLSQYQAEPVRTAKADQRMYPMTPQVDSAQVKIRKGTSTPNKVKPGNSVKLSMDYSVTLPPNMQTTPVTERWVLMKDGKQLADLPQQNSQRNSGGWVAEATIPIPKEADPGTYVIEHTVQAGDSYDTDESTFVVSH